MEGFPLKELNLKDTQLLDNHYLHLGIQVNDDVRVKELFTKANHS